MTTMNAVSIEVGLDGSTAQHSPARPHALQPPCNHRKCFAELVRQRADNHNTVVLAMTNAGFAPFWHNLRCSMERLDVARHAIIIGTDFDACNAALSSSVPCVVGGELLWEGHEFSQGATRHGTVEYARLMHIKARPALEVLRLGYHLLFTDTDMVWLQDPLRSLRAAHMRAIDAGLLDVLIQSDYDESNEASCSGQQHERCGRSAWCNATAMRCEDEVCGGFYFLRSGRPSIRLLEALFERMAWQRTHVDARIGEQPALNYVLRRAPGVRYEILPRELYPNGNAYFMRRVWPRARSRGSRASRRTTLPVIVHNNWIAGFEAKKQRFAEHGMWLLSDSGAGGESLASTSCIAAALPAPGGGSL